MAKAYRVKELSFINGRLCQPGAIVNLEIDHPGSNLEPVSASKAEKPAAGDATGGFKIKHNGGGNFVVVDAAGEQVGDVYKKDADDAGKAKADAQAEADRLNGSQPAEAAPVSDNLPDA